MERWTVVDVAHRAAAAAGRAVAEAVGALRRSWTRALEECRARVRAYEERKADHGRRAEAAARAARAVEQCQTGLDTAKGALAIVAALVPFVMDATKSSLARRANAILETFCTVGARMVGVPGAVLDGEAVSSRALSGGQTQLVHLACHLAMRELVAERAGLRANVVVLDEALSGVDSPTTLRVVAFLRLWAADRGAHVVLVSHDQGLRRELDDAKAVRVLKRPRVGGSS